MARPKFPLRIDAGNAHLTIYQHKARNRKRRCSYSQFKIAYRLNGQRRFETRSTLTQAQRRAAEILVTINNGQLNLLEMSNADSTAYWAAKEQLKPTGIQLETAAQLFAQAHKLLKGASLIEAVEYFTRQRPRQPVSKPIEDVVAELLEAKEKAGCSKVYRDDLDRRCNKFADEFLGMPILNMTAAEVRRFLTLKIFGPEKNETLGPRSHNNFLGALRTLFNFAKDRDYLPQDYRELDRVELLKDRGGDIAIYTPQEMADLLAHANDDDVLHLATCGFAGIRTEEFIRLDWQEFKWKSGVIEITAGKAKTAARRLVPIADNLRAWVEPIAKNRGQRGAVWRHSLAYLHESMYRKQGDKVSGLFVRAGVERKANALRHSYISYRVAKTKNVAEVALEAGNSPKMIFSNYRELVTAEDAAAWFAIMPAVAAEASDKIIALPRK